MRVWPNLLIVGTGKAGTTSLHEYLNNIPGIYMSKIKEPYFFSPVTKPNHPTRIKFQDENDYLSLFSDVKQEKIIGESSASYLSDPEAPGLIHQRISQAKIIISLRDPVERAFSHFLMNKSYGLTKTNFHDEILNEIKNGTNYTKTNIGLNDGLYSIHVKKYLDIFSLNQVKILIFEEWIKDPKKTLNEVLKFLGLDFNLTNFNVKVFNPYREIRTLTPRGPISKLFLKNDNIRKFSKKVLPNSFRDFLKKNILMNSHTKPTIKPMMDEKEKQLLVEFYKNDVQKLKVILGRDLPWEAFKIKANKSKI